MVAVVVGVSKYKYDGIGSPKLRNLAYAAADADAIAAHLVGSGFNVVDVLTDEKATLAEVRKVLNERVATAGKDDFVLLFWAGHSSADQEDPQKLFLLTHDTDPEHLSSTAYAMADFREKIASTASRRLMVVIDTCHAGGMADPTISYRSTGSGDVQAALRGVYMAESTAQDTVAGKVGAMRLVFTSSEAGEVSLESSKYGHGIFTYFLLQGLQGDADRNKDGTVTLDEIIEYTKSKVREFSNTHQNPTVAGYFDRSVLLGTYRRR